MNSKSNLKLNKKTQIERGSDKLGRLIPFDIIEKLANEYDAIECFWRESDVSFTGFVAEIWFNEIPSEFSIKCASLIKKSMKVRCLSDGVGKFALSVPVTVPCGEIQLGYYSRGSKVKLVH
ncbi:MAG: hypothetical protein AAF316_04470 [Cyanobacteria bacterium P01_A01_bin.80]